MKSFYAFLMGFILFALAMSGVFGYYCWDSLYPSIDLLEPDDIIISTLLCVLGGMVSILISSLLE